MQRKRAAFHASSYARGLHSDDDTTVIVHQISKPQLAVEALSVWCARLLAGAAPELLLFFSASKAQLLDC